MAALVGLLSWAATACGPNYSFTKNGEGGGGGGSYAGTGAPPPADGGDAGVGLAASDGGDGGEVCDAGCGGLGATCSPADPNNGGCVAGEFCSYQDTSAGFQYLCAAGIPSADL